MREKMGILLVERRRLSVIPILGICLMMIMLSSNCSFAASNSEIQKSVINVLYNGKGGSVLCDFNTSGKAYDGYSNHKHEGIDFQAKGGKGTSLYAIADGVVTAARKSEGMTTLAVYNSSNNLTVVYLHLDYALKTGDKVSRGDYIGKESDNGHGGKLSKPHTHISIRNGKKEYAAVSKDNTLVNPNPYPLYQKLGYPDGIVISDFGYRQNVSKSPVKSNASDGNLPSGISSIDAGSSCYFNVQVYKNTDLKQADLYVKKPGESGFSNIHTEKASVLRYAYWSANVGSKAGTLQYYWALTTTGGQKQNTKTGSLTVNNGTPPNPPKNLKSESLSTTSVKLSWSASSGATSYRIVRRAAGADSYQTIKSTTSTSYTDKGLSAGTRYWYRVYASNKAGESGKSESMWGYPKAVAPTITQVSGSTSLKVTWSGSTNSKTYDVYRKAAGESSFTVIKKGLTSKTYTDTGLKANTKYSYYIRHSCDWGDGKATINSEIGTGTTANEYYLDLNAELNGEYSGSLDTFGSADVSINGQKIADNVNDYYKKHAVGTKYEISDILAKDGYAYTGLIKGALSGTIGNSKVEVRLGYAKNANLGNDFYAYISNPARKKYVTNDSEPTNNVSLRSKNGSINQIWHFTRLEDGSYSILSVADGRVMDVANYGKTNGTNVGVWDYSANTAQQWYVCGTKGNYRLRAKCTQCLLDVAGGVNDEGTNLQMYTGNGGNAQIFDIEILSPFKVNFYNNYSGKNYILFSDLSDELNTQAVVSRDLSTSTLSLDKEVTHNGFNTMKVVNQSPGETGKDMAWKTSLQDTVANGSVGNQGDMILSFWAKASEEGTTASFRWGFEPTGDAKSVTLGTEWKYYTIPMKQSTAYNYHLHPWIDRAGTVWFSEIQLEDGTVATEFQPENGDLYTTVEETYGSKYSLPQAPVREGYDFVGWYTSASGGEPITETTDVAAGHRNVYAHWTAKTIVVESVEINKKELQLEAGMTETLTATVKPENATDPTVIWTSSDDAVATVSADGTVTAVAGGTATITATAGGQSTGCVVTVVNNPSVLIGDVNQDGKVDRVDAAILNRYLAKWDGYEQKIASMDAADINKDGKVDRVDAAILSRYLAKWDGYEAYFE